jgi:hypothetical protein
MSLLARTHESERLRGHSYLALIWVHAIVGAGFSLSVAVLLDLLVPLIYGPAYTVPPLAQALMALVVWMRINRGGPNTLMLFGTDTRPLMVGNAVLAVGFALAVSILPLIPRIESVLACLLVGETLSLAFFLRAAGRRTVMPAGPVLGHLAWSFAPVAIASAAAAGFSPDELWWRGVMLGFGAVVTGTQAIAGFHYHLLRNGLLAGSEPETEVAQSQAQ